MHTCSIAALLASTSVACGPKSRTKTATTTPATSTAAARPVIDAKWLGEFVSALSTDDMAGRFTLDAPTLDRAATMIADEYRALGLAHDRDDFRMPYEFEWGTTLGASHHVWIEREMKAAQLAHESYATLSPPTDLVPVGDAVYVGSKALGGKPSALAPVKGRIAVIDDPRGADDPAPAELHADLEPVVAQLATAGALAVLVLGDRGGTASADAFTIPVLALRRDALVEVSPQLAGAVKGRARGTVVATDARVSIAAQRIDVPRTAYNVLGWIPGTTKAKEVVLLGAHFDHIGTTTTGIHCRPIEADVVCNGADDNASGTAVVVAIAKAFASAGIRPARTIAFAHFSGEEMGLFGSKAMAELPQLAGGEVVAMVNFDMVGRLGKDGLWVGAVSTSDQWMELLLADEDRPKVETVYEASVTARSDHASFYAKEIPVLFFFTGLHDDYHRPGDEFARLNLDGMTAIAQTALGLVQRLGDGAPIAYRPPGQGGWGLVSRLPGSDPSSVVTPGATKPASTPAPKPAPRSAPKSEGGKP